MLLRCPVCNSGNFGRTKETRNMSLLPYYKNEKFQVEVDNYICLECGAEGDFDNTNDEKITNVMRKAKADRSVAILDCLKHHNLSPIFICLTFGLPLDTMKKWSEKQFTDSEVALLIILYESVVNDKNILSDIQTKELSNSMMPIKRLVRFFRCRIMK